MAGSLGRLERVEPRQVWEREDLHFTPWLAGEENLQLLGEALGLVLELVGQEQAVGPFRADLLCCDEAGSFVLVENQLQRTDHRHLGQLLTYAAGLDAVTFVWIAPSFADEHRAALDWLNEHTDSTINAFGLEIELWRIGDSAVAPKFNVVSQPNNWSRAVQRTVPWRSGQSALTDLEILFWTAYAEYLSERSSPLRRQRPASQGWMTHSLRKSGCWLAACAAAASLETREDRPELRAELGLSGPLAEQRLARLLQLKPQAESDLGFELACYDRPDVPVRRLYVRAEMDFRDEARWPEQFEWLRSRLEPMYRVFAPIVRDL